MRPHNHPRKGAHLGHTGRIALLYGAAATLCVFVCITAVRELASDLESALRYGVYIGLVSTLVFTSSLYVFMRRAQARLAKAAEAQRESEERFRLAFDQQFQFMALLSPDGRVLEFNDLLLRAQGAKREECVGKLFWHVPLWKDMPDWQEKIEWRIQQAATMKEPLRTEDKIKTAEGQIRLLEACFAAIRDKEGELRMILAQATDVTERKSAELALRESEARYRALFEQTHDAVLCYEFDSPIPNSLPAEEQERLILDGRVVECNDAGISLHWVKSREKLMGRRLGELASAQDLDVGEEIRTFIKRGYRLVDYEVVEKRLDGTTHYFRDNALGVSEDGALVRIWMAVHDITERKRAEEIIEAIYEGTAGAVGGEFFRELVRSLGELLGVRYALLGELLPGDVVRTEAAWADGEFVENFEYALRGTPCAEVLQQSTCSYASDVQAQFPGDELLAEMAVESYMGTPLRDSEGNATGLLVVMDDQPGEEGALVQRVLEVFAARAGAELGRRGAEQSLRQSETRFRAIIDTSRDWIWSTDVAGNRTYSNPAVGEILGYSAEHVTGTKFSELLHPGDRKKVVELLKEKIAEVSGWTGVVLRWRHKDGQYRYLESSSVPILGADAQVLGFRGVDRDITDRKQTELALREALDKIQSLQERVEAENVYLREEIRQAHLHGDIVSGSDAMKSVLVQVEQVAATDSTVLILGETGTGKELVARAVHNASPRRDKPLVVVNCAAMPAALVESELFGREKGAYTGALNRQVGRFEAANGGTIFLDEIGELPGGTQAKLLRVLQEGQFERLGSTKTISVNVRVIAATNRDLEREVHEGTFREDLFFRLEVFPITIPPLRERRDDIEPLVWSFAKEFATKMGRRIDTISQADMDRLRAYPWPGNVRELRNVVERAMIGVHGERLKIRPPSKGTVRPPREEATLEEVQRRHILSVLEERNWQVRGEDGAAKILGLHPSTLDSRMAKMGIKRPDRL